MEKYEVKGVSQASEIRRAYEEAVAQNIKYYRAVSNSGKIYGWNNEILNPDGTKGHFALAVAGQEWFENDKYVEPIINENSGNVDNEIIDEAVNTLDEIVEEIKEETKEEIAEPIIEQPAETVSQAEAIEPEQEQEKIKEETVSEETAVKNESEPANEIDYKALYEEKCKEFDNYKTIVEAFKAL